MPRIQISDFKGILPRLSPKLLPENYAQTAKNCDLRRGLLRALRDLSGVLNMGSGTRRSIYNMYPGCIGDTWFGWSDDDINVVELQIAGTYRIAYSDPADYPKQTECAWAGSDGDPPATTRRLGVVAPTTALTVAKLGTPGTDVVDTVSYVYTRVTAFGEESAPCPVPTPDTVDIYTGEYVRVNGFEVPSLSGTGNEIVSFRLYRTVTGSDGTAEYQLVKARPNSTTATPVYDIPVGTGTGEIDDPADYVYDCNDIPDALNDELGEVLPSEDWDPPPDSIKGLCQFQNGVLAGYYGNTMYLSSPDAYYAFPGAYQYNVASAIRAIGIYNEDLIIATDRRPYVLSGIDPASMTKVKFDINQSCTSKRGFVITHFGALWPSPDGMFLFNGTPPGQLLTENIYTRDQWQALDIDSIIGFYHDRKYFGFFEGTNTGFILPVDTPEPYIITVEITNKVYGGYADPTDDALYLLTFDGVDYLIERWEGAATYMAMTWKSRIELTPPINYAAAQVVGDFSGGNITFKYYVDGTLKLTKTVSSAELFRLPSGFKGREAEIQVETTDGVIDVITIATTAAELRGTT